MLKMWDVGDVRCWGCGMLGMWGVVDVECWECRSGIRSPFNEIADVNLRL